MNLGRQALPAIGVDVALAGACVLAASITLADVSAPLRAPLTLVALVFGCGTAVVGWVGVQELALRVSLVLAVGIAVPLVVAEAVVQLHWWEPAVTVAALLLLGAISIVCQVVAVVRRGTR